MTVPIDGNNDAVYLEIIRYTLYAIGVVTMLGIGETLRRLIRIEKKQDEQAQAESRCRESLKEYAKWEDLMGESGVITEIKKDRTERWRSQEELNRSREREISRLKTKAGLE